MRAKVRCRHTADQIRKHVSKCDHRPGDEHADYGAVFNIISRLERIVPVIEKFRDMAPEAKSQNQSTTEMEKSTAHVSLGCQFYGAWLKVI